ncbi:acetyl-CoA carboxylase biotin carboxyl carrier protein [Niallia taxi]|uniref:acetyl-CoA carboxylase biotin carboxyl carrier protein n=1 Tax=Niallia taxi TaxID=2499688 RepID=UPI0012443A6B|nr:acetyl-CoA carboxylase biotin carboxyl carrier protein [Niallia taxi]MDK8639726.1 acetyl-CoA carboxylase biotin carboxyl carrier protein [Niallia taxi]MED4038100.1 acetyl-CoA carboxylase biotin carboxyl carrier protein [Niallia taxi]MED4055493.1 acetyl-CoA carboxylase biotin carboxyl carrier protein [Niallia taxi]MED4117684.1 acetyl-CoA carboxylase biotin carboxyl carrier protein [Niallia taxi]
MLKIEEIKDLINLINDSNISDFVYENEGAKVEIKKNRPEVQAIAAVSAPAQQVQAVQPQAAQVVQEEVAQAPAVSSNENLHKVTSPMVGTFYQSATPDAPAYVSVGDKVSKDTVVCIVEAMKLFNEITAEVEGEIVEILVKDGELVEYGEPLFLVKAL